MEGVQRIHEGKQLQADFEATPGPYMQLLLDAKYISQTVPLMAREWQVTVWLACISCKIRPLSMCCSSDKCIGTAAGRPGSLVESGILILKAGIQHVIWHAKTNRFRGKESAKRGSALACDAHGDHRH